MDTNDDYDDEDVAEEKVPEGGYTPRTAAAKLSAKEDQLWSKDEDYM